MSHNVVGWDFLVVSNWKFHKSLTVSKPKLFINIFCLMIPYISDKSNVENLLATAILLNAFLKDNFIFKKLICIFIRMKAAWVQHFIQRVMSDVLPF